MDLSNCGWLSNHSLMSIAKLPELTELSLCGCFRMGDVFAYTALATKCGFKKLEDLDMRGTNIGDTEWSCFGRLPRIKRFLAGKVLPPEEERREKREKEGKVKEQEQQQGDSGLDEGLTDRGVSSLVMLVQQGHGGHPCLLEELVLTKTGVTNGVMASVGRGFPALRLVDARGTRVTEAGACDLKKARPECRVLFDPEGSNPLAGKPPAVEHNAEDFILIQAPHFQ